MFVCLKGWSERSQCVSQRVSVRGSDTQEHKERLTTMHTHKPDAALALVHALLVFDGTQVASTVGRPAVGGDVAPVCVCAL